jgi:hypothetical protein
MTIENNIYSVPSEDQIAYLKYTLGVSNKIYERKNAGSSAEKELSAKSDTSETTKTDQSIADRKQQPSNSTDDEIQHRLLNLSLLVPSSSTLTDDDDSDDSLTQLYNQLRGDQNIPDKTLKWLEESVTDKIEKVTKIKQPSNKHNMFHQIQAKQVCLCFLVVSF